MKKSAFVALMAIGMFASSAAGADHNKDSQPYVGSAPTFACEVPVAGACFALSGSATNAVISINDAVGDKVRGTYRFDEGTSKAFCGSATAVVPQSAQKLYVSVGGDSTLDCGSGDIATTGTITVNYA